MNNKQPILFKALKIFMSLTIKDIKTIKDAE